VHPIFFIFVALIDDDVFKTFVSFMNRLQHFALTFISCAAVLMSACQHDDDEATDPQNLLTFQVDADATVGDEGWIFATDETGKVLDVSTFTAGSTTTLVGTSHVSEFNVTVLTVEKIVFSGGTTEFATYKLGTYTKLQPGATLHQKADADPSQPTSYYSATFNVANMNALQDAISFSNGYGSNFGGIIDDSGGKYNARLNLAGSAPSDVLLWGFRGTEPAYAWAKGVKQSDVINLDFTKDFATMPHLTQLNFPGMNKATIDGLKASTGKTYRLMDTHLLTNASDSYQPTIGYIDGFDSYQTMIWNRRANGIVLYSKVGTVNIPASLPTFTFSAIKSDLRDFAFNFSEDYTYYIASWKYTSAYQTTFWSVIGPPNTTAKGLALPDEITAKYPDIDMSKAVYFGVNYAKILSGGSYAELMTGGIGEWDPQESIVYSPY